MSHSPHLLERQQLLRERPVGKPVMFQTWQELLFLHWRMPPEVVQALLPPGLTVDTFDGAAWLGVVPFQMRNIRPARLPAVPWVSNFLELNVRTYAVDEHGTPGVWFLSLDANRWLAVQTARRWFRLPYHWARMAHHSPTAGASRYSSRRHTSLLKTVGEYAWTRSGPVELAQPGKLDFFLVERYVLFASLPGGKLATGRVHHVPYPLQQTELLQWSEHPLADNGLELTGRVPDHITSSAGVQVDVFGLQTLPQVVIEPR